MCVILPLLQNVFIWYEFGFYLLKFFDDDLSRNNTFFIQIY